MLADVLVEIRARNVDKSFSYNIPNEIKDKVKIGIRVSVPFGKQNIEGIVLNITNDRKSDLKDIKDVLDEEPILNEELLELGKYVQEKTLSTLISCYLAMLPKALKVGNKNKINKKYERIAIINKEYKDLKLNDKELLILKEIENGNNRKSDLLKINSSLNTLIKHEIVSIKEVEVYRDVIINKEENVVHELNNDQKNAVKNILESDNNISLLYGVTGSGKTEVYMELIEHARKENKSSIVLVPEISLTPQMVNRFVSRFGNKIAVLHSSLSDGEKYDEYRKIARREVDIVIGARSAIFAPLENIGVIIIDEEHSTTYKQENNPKYNTIDVAIERCKNHNAKLVMGSATPSLESFSRAYAKVYNLVTLNKRANNKDLPLVEIIDMNKENKTSHFSKDLIEGINTALSNKEQIILLLNRRGYASFITCSNCGFVSKCPNCDITLTYHKTSDMERCHYCGYAKKRDDICPECHEKAIKNLGVGTEKIEEELNKIFPFANIVRMDFDTTSTKGAHERIISDFRNHKYDILLGTQMISKGLDFPNVTLVGVINADTSLMIPNFRSSEYTFDLLSQVSGRSGRGDKEGKVIIQTYNSDHYAIKLAKYQDYIGFFNEEMKLRKKLFYPPYSYIISIKVMSSDYELASKESSYLAKKLKENIKSEVLGPSTSYAFKVKNVYKFGIIIKYKKDNTIYPYLKQCLDYYKSNNKVNIDIDFNPVNVF